MMEYDRAVLGCIVDNHSDIVSFLFACWKRRHLISNGLTLVHFDSHPDIDPPPISTTECGNPTHLIDSLDKSDGGISEFILPLVVNKHVDRVVWYKPPWSDQIEDGCYTFVVGDVASVPEETVESRMCVSLYAGYFLDDGVCYDEVHEMQNTLPLSLLVHTLLPSADDFGRASTPIDSASCENTNTPWILDICLDYFYVHNPFISKIERLAEPYLSDADTRALIRNLRPLIAGLRFRCDCGGCRTSVPPREKRKEREAFHTFLGSLCRTYGRSPGNSSLLSPSEEGPSLVACPLGSESGPDKVGSSARGEIDSGRIKERFLSFLILDDTHARATTGAITHPAGLKSRSSASFSRCIDLFMQLLATAGDRLSTEDRIQLFESILLINLPHSSVVDDTDETPGCEAGAATTILRTTTIDSIMQRVDAMIAQMCSVLRSIAGSEDTSPQHLRGRSSDSTSTLTGMLGPRPGVICIARSDTDGYTPPDLVDAIQARVIDALGQLYGGGAEGIELVDIREDPERCSRTFFMDLNYRKAVKRKLCHATDSGTDNEVVNSSARHELKMRLLRESGFDV